MAAVAGQEKFFVDESALGLAKALGAARKDTVFPGHPLLPQVPLGALDTEWMPVIAHKGLVVISRDRRIRTKPVELRAYRDHGLGTFWLAGKRDLSTWEYLCLIVRMWEKIEETIDRSGDGPWFAAVSSAGVRHIPV